MKNFTLIDTAVIKNQIKNNMIIIEAKILTKTM
jgi:hypothetical protein